MGVNLTDVLLGEDRVTVETITDDLITGGTTGAELQTAKGAVDGYAPLDGTSKVPAVNLPSYVDDVEEYADFASLPVTGEIGKIYITLDTNLTYRWSGSVYVQVGGGAEEVLEYADLASFPATGEVSIIYIALDTNSLYRWDTSTYVQVGGGEIPNATATVVGGVTAYFDVATGELYLRNDGLDATPAP